MANGNFGGGTGTIQNPYLIEDIHDFSAIRDYRNSHFKQVSHIVATGTPIETLFKKSDGTYSFDSFTGSYDGNNLTITNLENDPGTDDWLSFSSFPGTSQLRQHAPYSLLGNWSGMFRDVTINGFTFTSPLGADSITRSFGCLFDTANAYNVHLKNANITLSHNGQIGTFMYNGTASGCSFSGNINATVGERTNYSSSVGGVAGFSWSGNSIGCEAHGRIDSLMGAYGFTGIGKCSSCWTDMVVVSHAPYHSLSYNFASGFIGMTINDVDNCYSLATVVSLNLSATGFLAHPNRRGNTGQFNSTIRNCYTMAKVYGATQAHGFSTGKDQYSRYSRTNFENCFALIDTLYLKTDTGYANSFMPFYNDNSSPTSGTTINCYSLEGMQVVVGSPGGF